jgi:hypothetical protein
MKASFTTFKWLHDGSNVLFSCPGWIGFWVALLGLFNSSRALALAPPLGWAELRALAPNRVLWIHQVSPTPVSQSALVAVQIHDATDPKIQSLQREIELWKASGRVPELSPLKVIADSREEFVLKKNQDKLPCTSFAAVDEQSNRWRQTWCFTQKNQALASIERGEEQISERVRLSLLEEQWTTGRASM